VLHFAVLKSDKLLIFKWWLIPNIGYIFINTFDHSTERANWILDAIAVGQIGLVLLFNKAISASLCTH
jgi:hypothetical protein